MPLLTAILIVLAVALVLLAVLFTWALAAAGSRADDERGYDWEPVEPKRTFHVKARAKFGGKMPPQKYDDE